MKDFKSYSNEQPDKRTETAQKSTAPPDVNSTVELAKLMSKAMNGKSETQILHTIISEAERGKREGTLTNADLDNFYTALSPLLDGFKKRKLREVITRLKNIQP